MLAEDRILDKRSLSGTLEKGVWYPMSPTGYLSEPRVGHTASYFSKQHKVIFIGGANPSTVHKETWSLDLSTLTCNRLMTKGDFQYRYEHCAFVPKRCGPMGESVAMRVWVFGGADMEGNKNDLWELDVDGLKWNSLTHQGTVPTKRTIHTASSLINNDLLVFGGGAFGAEAEPDTQVYQLNIANRSWSVKKTKGDPPQSRHGHVLVAVKDKLYIHGGLSGTTFFDDLHVLSSDGTWSAVTATGSKPCARASHGAVSHEEYIYLFGGLCSDGALNDFWRINTENSVWEQITVDYAPSPRLDFAITLVDLPAMFVGGQSVKNDNKEPDEDSVNSIEEYLSLTGNANVGKVADNKGDSKLQKVWSPFILIHGGMDDGGQTFDDFHAYGLVTNH